MLVKFPLPVCAMASCLIAACTTHGEMAAKNPRAIYQSDRSMRDLEECISAGVSAGLYPAPQVTRNTSATELEFGHTLNRIANIRIIDGQPRMVEVRTPRTYGTVIRRPVENCL